MDDNIRIPDCAGCIHRQVCTYMNDMAALCAAIRRLSINRHETDGNVSIKTVADYNHLAEVAIECKHYLKEIPKPSYQLYRRSSPPL